VPCLRAFCASALAPAAALGDVLRTLWKVAGSEDVVGHAQ